MKSVDDIHNEAMDHAHHGLRHRRRGDDEAAREMFGKALALELEAITALGDASGHEFSVMHRSAATLAIDCRDYALAERLASQGLAGNPPEHLACELRDVIEQARSSTQTQPDSL